MAIMKSMTQARGSDRPPAARLLAHLRSASSGMVPSERRVVQVFLESPGEVIGWSTAGVAERARTSTATVVRACQRLGFTGFHQLRSDLARIAENSPASPPSHDLVDRVFEAARSEINSTLALLNRDAFSRAVEAIASAGKVLLLGTGGSSIPAQDAALRLTMSGRNATAPADALTQLFSARLLCPEDVCVAVSFSGANTYTLRAAEAAREANASIIAVTSTPLSPITRIADVILLTGTASLETEVLSSRVTHGLLLNALNLSVQEAAGEPSFGPSEALSSLLNGVLSDQPDIEDDA